MKKILLVILVLIFYVEVMASVVVCWPEEEVTDIVTTRLMRVDWCGVTQDGVTVLCDKEGHKWVMDAVTINSDNIMIEINNNNTPDRYWDDTVVNVRQSAIWGKRVRGIIPLTLTAPPRQTP
jgi:hypothetical protein